MGILLTNARQTLGRSAVSLILAKTSLHRSKFCLTFVSSLSHGVVKRGSSLFIIISRRNYPVFTEFKTNAPQRRTNSEQPGKPDSSSPLYHRCQWIASLQHRSKLLL